MHKQILFALVGGLWLAGCVPNLGEVPSNEETAGATTPGLSLPGLLGGGTDSAATAPLDPSPKELSFIDGQYFDQALSTVMQQTSTQITISLPSRFPTSKVPERLDKWLAAVQAAGGKVQLKPSTAAKSASFALESLLYTAYSVYEAYQANAMYTPAAAYDATLYYSKNSGSEETLVDKVIFTQR